VLKRGRSIGEQEGSGCAKYLKELEEKRVEQKIIPLILVEAPASLKGKWRVSSQKRGEKLFQRREEKTMGK